MPLPADAPVSAWIHDFVHSKNHKFKKDSPKKRIKRAIAAYYAQKRRSESKRRADRHLREGYELFLEFYKDEHDAYSRHKTRQQIVGLLNQAYIHASHGHSALDHAIRHWLDAEVHEFGHFETMPEANLRDNWDDYCSLMTGAHEAIDEAAMLTAIVKAPKSKYNRKSYIRKTKNGRLTAAGASFSE